MKKIITSTVVLALSANIACAAQNLIFDHDGGVDDFVALSLVSCDPKFNLKAITVVPADSYKKTAVEVTKKITDASGLSNIAISGSNFEGTNPFPHEWRQHSDIMAKLPALSKIKEKNDNKVLAVDSHVHLAELLSNSDKYAIIATGPLSNIAEALKLNPKIKENISRIYFMGGAVRVTGNVEDKDHDQTAEWNVYNNPEAADIVLKSGIPMTLVPLDATQYVPVNSGLMAKLKNQPSSASQIVHAINGVLGKYVAEGSVYFWDTLTAAVALDPTILTTEKMKVKVVVGGTSQGRTIESIQGAEIDVAQKVSQEKFENLLLNKLGSCKWAM